MNYRVLILALLLTGCSGGNNTPSTGLKIFITEETHAGDFAGDPTLPGTTAIQKADAFCNSSRSKPSDDTYKALIVDGTSRDAVSLTDWVLKPDTDYYQAFNDVLIDRTTNAAIFAAYYRSMKNPIDPCGKNCAPEKQRTVWTGMIDASTFEAGTAFYNCNEWGQAGSITSQSGVFSLTTEIDGRAFATNGYAGCTTHQFPVYCVQQ
ncbi:DUF1554 domain-containing protein [Stenotrophobium rhamnosiphilum]|uniref:DUF1554 domain-containing protein n=1 Tax=Stenotrophobium rhamnosiphilum TaxID=2029166 RepID=A0A2T5MHT6_9GAMM|nr:DUF1554 domain-containing protein [Stenotrophobium rhamnosiphilum]PTU32120.1 hypothetical protein CJD38_05480 [Stenotrophobium rhamnosiphilum]